jgi:hypothetical protein
MCAEYSPRTPLVARACARGLAAISNPARPVADGKARLITGPESRLLRPSDSNLWEQNFNILLYDSQEARLPLKNELP